jgi:hypothetical protein
MIRRRSRIQKSRDVKRPGLAAAQLLNDRPINEQTAMGFKHFPLPRVIVRKGTIHAKKYVCIIYKKQVKNK